MLRLALNRYEEKSLGCREKGKKYSRIIPHFFSDCFLLGPLQAKKAE